MHAGFVKLKASVEALKDVVARRREAREVEMQKERDERRLKMEEEKKVKEERKLRKEAEKSRVEANSADLMNRLEGTEENSLLKDFKKISLGPYADSKM